MSADAAGTSACATPLHPNTCEKCGLTGIQPDICQFSSAQLGLGPPTSQRSRGLELESGVRMRRQY